MAERTRVIQLRQPDDWHAHLRDGDLLKAVAGYTARVFRRAIVMPNLVPPITTTDSARAYKQRIADALSSDSTFEPLMTCYLTDDIDPNELERGFREGVFFASKLYPAHATTNSQFGVTSLDRIDDALSRMERIGMPLLVHGEVASPDVDVFDREKVFVATTLPEILRRYPELRVVLEHVTSAEGVDFVRQYSGPLAGTITPHHLILTRTSLFAGGMHPHLYCLPVAKTEADRIALRKAATSGSERFFLGTDSAPHSVVMKESAAAPAGVFNAVSALECYAQVFDEENAMMNLEAFASLNGPRFHGVRPNPDEITLERRPFVVPETVVAGSALLRPFLAGSTLTWAVSDRALPA